MNIEGKTILRIEADDEFKLSTLGDFHWGSPYCNGAAIKRALESSKNIILMGDLIECATRYSIGAGVYEQGLNAQEQVEQVLELLEPHKDKIIGLHSGNHELRVYRESGIDVSSMIARALDVPYLGYAGYIEIKTGKKLWSIYSTHGSTGAATTTGKMRKCHNLTDVARTDIYLMAHTHALAQERDNVGSIRYGRFTPVERHFVLTGSFLEYGGYAEIKNYPRMDTGFAELTLKEDAVHVNLVKMIPVG